MRPTSHLTVRFPALLVAALVLMPAVTFGQVQVKTLADGSKLIYNENQVQRARRTATNLLPVPSSEIERLIDIYARKQGLSPKLVQAMVQVESGYNPKALSNKGAMGLMQLMPPTAKELDVTDPYDPEQNVRGGTAYLQRLLTRYSGDLTLALAAYNAGPSAVDRFDGVPPYGETRNYVHKVLALYRGNGPSSLYQVQARADARLRQQHEAAVEARRALPKGNDVFLVRDENNRIIFTTSPPKSN